MRDRDHGLPPTALHVLDPTYLAKYVLLMEVFSRAAYKRGSFDVSRTPTVSRIIMAQSSSSGRPVASAKTSKATATSVDKALDSMKAADVLSCRKPELSPMGPGTGAPPVFLEGSRIRAGMNSSVGTGRRVSKIGGYVLRDARRLKDFEGPQK